MARIEIHTIPDLKKYIKKADLVLMKIRFGCSESRVKISKTEALGFIHNNYADDLTPDDCEMYCGFFGDFEDGILYMG